MVTCSTAALRLLIGVFALGLAMPASAQAPDDDLTGPAPAHIAYIDGAVALTRDAREETATPNVPLVAGDRLRTTQGRAEVIYGDGSVLDLDQFTTVDFLSDELARLLDGRVRLTIAGVEGRDRVAYRVDTASGAVWIEEPGEYRISLIGTGGRSDVEVVTIRGFARLVNEFGDTDVQAGERAVATASLAPSYAQAYNSATWDAFDQWAADRRDERTGTVSARYLPEEVHGYAGAFDRYGDWRHDPAYGYVWYPHVHVSWRPYHHGSWRYYRPWGWTWIAYDSWWGWPTHHFGRWGFNAGVWFWIPTRRWAPAHVYWASAPGYVGWAPLGWHGRPVLSIINVNVRRGHDPWRAWTVVPRSAFGSHVDVRRHAVARNSLRAVERSFVGQSAAPVRPVGVRRNQSPIYSAGRSTAAAQRERVGGAPSRISEPRTSAAPAARERADGGPVRRAEPRTSAGPVERERAGGAAVRTTAPRASARPARDPGSPGAPGGVRAPRATLPAAPGALGDAGSARSRSAPAADRPERGTPRYRDLGPGGPEPSAQTRERATAPARGRSVTGGSSTHDAAPGSIRRGGPDPGATPPAAAGSAPSRRSPGSATPRYAPPSGRGAPDRQAPSAARESASPRRGGSAGVSAPARGASPRAAPAGRSYSPPPRSRESAPAARPRTGGAPSRSERSEGASRAPERSAPRTSKPRPR